MPPCGGGYGSVPLWIAIPVIIVGTPTILIAGGVKAGVHATKKGIGGTIDGTAYVVRGTAHGIQALGDSMLSVEKLSRLIVEDPKNAELRLQRAKVSLAQGKIDLAIQELQVLLSLEPDNIYFYNLLGSLYDRIFDHQKALEIFDAAIAKITATPTLLQGDAPSIRKLGKHRFQLATFHHPTFCAHCKVIIMGLRHQGYKCSVCQVTSHIRCATKTDASIECVSKKKKGSKNSALQCEHSFAETTFYHPTWCFVCRCLLKGLRKQGLKCSKCSVTVHDAENCLQALKSINSSPTASPSGTKKEEDPEEKEPEEKVVSSENFSHQFFQRTFFYPTWCSSCEKIIHGVRRQGYECFGCGKTSHKKCLEKQSSDVCIPSHLRKRAEGHTKTEEDDIIAADLYCNRGLVYYHASKYDEALKDFNQALQLLEADEAKLLSSQKSQKASEEKELQRNRNQKRRFMYLANRGFTYYYLDEYEHCISDLTRVIDLNKTHSDARIYETRAAAHQRLGKHEFAERDHKLAMKLDKTLPVKVFPFAMPLELIAHVFSFLPINTLQACRQTCKLWNQIIMSTPNSPVTKSVKEVDPALWVGLMDDAVPERGYGTFGSEASEDWEQEYDEAHYFEG